MLVKAAARISNGILYAYHNAGNFDFDTNGEKLALEAFSSWNGNKQCVIWDVGAHKGDWADLAHTIIRRSHIYGFEIVPSIFATIPKRDWLTSANIGLSDRSGNVDVTFSVENPTSSSLSPRSDGGLYESVEMVRCRVEAGDSLIDSGVPAPDLLKIDTEGHEIAVLTGCSRLLTSEQRPTLIQFEYGQTYLPGRNTLREAFDLLVPHGYVIGRLFPTHVDFKEYSYSDDNFLMGNFIAVCDRSLADVLR